jgi:hypothetical protein
MKKTFFLFLLLVSFSLSGQQISFSNSIVSSQEKNLVEIRELWKSYLQDCVRSFIKKDKSITAKYWNEEEIENGFYNLVMYQITPTFPLCLFGENITIDITKVDNDFYRIKNLVLITDSISKSIPVIYNIYAKKENSQFKFYTQFFFSKSALNKSSTKNIDYYYSSDFNFDKNEADKAEEFYSKLIYEFDYKPEKKITYIVAENPEKASKYIGFDYSIRSNTLNYSGYYLEEQNIIISGQVSHNHELVHSVIESKFPNVPRLFNEGISTYLAGTCGESLDFHIEQLFEIMNSIPETDFSNFNDWDKLINNNKTNPYYTIGAIFIKYAYDTGGSQKVLSLFQYKNTNEDTFAAIRNELGIDKNEIDKFLKNYINELKRKD